MGGVTYDAGALLAAERADRRLWALHRRSLERGQRPTVPAAVLAQAWRGGPQADLSRLLSGCRIDSMDETAGRRAGEACGKARTSDVVDAAVVVGALGRNDLVVTSDRDDLVRIARALGSRLDVVRV